MTEKSTKKSRFNGSYIATAAMFLIVVFIWRDLARTKEAQNDLATKNHELLEELSTAREELDSLKSGPSSRIVHRTSGTRERPIAKPVEMPETLFLQTPNVTAKKGVLTARFKFEPDGNTPLPEQLTLVVRIPVNTDARILSLKPVSIPAFSGVEFLVNAQGSLGMIEGSPTELEALEFELSVSAPVKATVRGSKGIKAFEMDITSSGCSIRKM